MIRTELINIQILSQVHSAFYDAYDSRPDEKSIAKLPTDCDVEVCDLVYDAHAPH